MWFFLSLFLQQVLGHSPLETGLDFLPMTLSIVAAATLAPRFVARFGAKAVLTAGMLLAAAGLGVLAELDPESGYVPVVLFGGIVAAVGLGTSMVPATIAAVQGVRSHETGLASGMVNTSRLVGGALGLAALSTLATSHASSEVAAGTAPLVAQTDGYQLALLTGSVLCLVGALAALVMLPSHAAGSPQPVAGTAAESA
jgi:Na+/melibiose symporter-like transporter